MRDSTILAGMMGICGLILGFWIGTNFTDEVGARWCALFCGILIYLIAKPFFWGVDKERLNVDEINLSDD